MKIFSAPLILFAAIVSCGSKNSAIDLALNPFPHQTFIFQMRVMKQRMVIF